MKLSVKLLTIFILIINFSSVFAQKVKFSTEVIKEKSDKLQYELSVSYSLLDNYKDTSAQNGFNGSVKDLVMGDVNYFKESLKDWTPIENMYSNYELSDSVLFINDRMISVKYYGYMYYSGAAHPLTFFMSLNYDLIKKKSLTLGDFFSGDYLGVISSYCISEIKKRIGEYSDNDWINSGAGPKEENYKIFNISKKHLLITFPVYQVAPYVAGPQEVEIPFSVLKKVIPANSILKKIIE